tara:strand:- start:458 stop:1300 length:843 start_codon:yes stop_codon:yes gene_type:complete
MSFYEKISKEIKQPKIMGILNLTPDSFFDGGKYNEINRSILKINQMISDGADIIDIGAVSTRPGSKPISYNEEKERLIPTIKMVRKLYPEIVLSVDTFCFQIAQDCIDLGVDIINNVNLFYNESKMINVISKNNNPYVLMHIKGNPETMQQNPHYDDFQKDIISFFKNYIKKLNSFGIKNIIIDPGFGFGKSLDDNYKLMNMIPMLKKFGYPVLIGISRKSMISKTLKINTVNSLNGTTILNTIGVLFGADIIRVHDVKEAVEIVKIFKKINKNKVDNEH